MTRAVVFRLAARREFDEAAEWYQDQRAGLGLQFVFEVDCALQIAAESPERFPIMHRETRCVRVRRFPYSVFFNVEPDRIVILAVFHARRNPLIWQHRR